MERTRAVRMTAQNVGEGDIKNVRAVLGANDIHAANMVRKRFRISDRRRRKAKRKKKCPKRRGPRWDSNPRGYEQEIGPDHQRTGRHEPSSYTCDRGINFKNTGTGYGQYAHSKGISAQPTELRL